jgi:hypothetical protein
MVAVLRVALLACVVVLGTHSATLEKLSVDQMSQKATLIVRGRVTACAGEAVRTVIYTKCTATVTERWKGNAGGTVQFVVPGGRAQGLVQTFIGTPKLASGAEYVLFLWAGRSGINQIIGLSQGVFDLKDSPGGVVQAKRAAATERMLDEKGNLVADNGVELPLAELRSRVKLALTAENEQ